jgi:glycosyltransferase involved in cell wall biosynthesis
VSVIVMPLGEAPREAMEAALGGLPDLDVDADTKWFDRRGLRRRPLETLLGLWRRRVDRAVLVAADLDQPRLRLTSMLLGLPRARSYWRVDFNGRRERWSLSEHLARNLAPIVRHALGCLLALILAEPLLQALATPVAPRDWTRASRPRRVLYLRSQLWLGLRGGGSVAHTAGVIGGLEQLGVDVRVVSSDALLGVRAPTRVVRPEVWFDGWLRELEDLAYNVAFFGAAWRVARRFRPHVIYQRHTAFNVSGAVLSRVLGLPLVLEYNSSEIWKGRHWGGLRLERAATLVERINLRAASRVIVVSRVLYDELVGAGVAADRIVVNPNGVDPTLFRPDLGGTAVRERHGLGSSIVVGFSGTFGAWHGIPTLAQVVPRVLAARHDVRWLLVGDGPLHSLLESGDARVVHAGMRSHAEMPAYLAACDVLVSPHGRQADGGEFFGSPTKLYEYMAAGRPIVASRVGQIGEVLADEHSALLVAPDDVEGLTKAVVRLIDDAALRSRLGAAAREAAETRHTWRQNAQRALECVVG